MDFERRRVNHYYWNRNLNCATTVLKVLAERFDLDLAPQVVDAATGLHGAGEYGAQCGLVEGGLMFLGIIGHDRGYSASRIAQACCRFASAFETCFSSLICRELRPEGFHPDNPPHLCEEMTCRAIDFTRVFVESFIAPGALDRMPLEGAPV